MCWSLRRGVGSAARKLAVSNTDFVLVSATEDVVPVLELGPLSDTLKSIRWLIQGAMRISNLLATGRL